MLLVQSFMDQYGYMRLPEYGTIWTITVDRYFCKLYRHVIGPDAALFPICASAGRAQSKHFRIYAVLYFPVALLPD